MRRAVSPQHLQASPVCGGHETGGKVSTAMSKIRTDPFFQVLESKSLLDGVALEHSILILQSILLRTQDGPALVRKSRG